MWIAHELGTLWMCCDPFKGRTLNINVVAIMSLWGPICTHTHSTCIAMNMMCHGVYGKVNSYMHPYILLCMQSVWLARYEYVLYKGVYVKGFLTYVHPHTWMNEYGLW